MLEELVARPFCLYMYVDGADLGLHYLPDLSVQKLTMNIVSTQKKNKFFHTYHVLLLCI